MRRLLGLATAFVPGAALWLGGAGIAAADVVTDWITVMNHAVQTDTAGATLTPGPTWASRNMAIVATSMYDAVNCVDHTHQPYEVNLPGDAAVTNKEAAAIQAAYRTLSSLYPAQQATFDNARATSLGALVDTPARINAGIALGNSVGTQLYNSRLGDGAGGPSAYVPTGGLGHWASDPLHPGQTPLSPEWGSVTPFGIASGSQFRPPAPPALNSPEYTAAFQEVYLKGDINAEALGNRTHVETQTGHFWGYDIGGLGPPPVLYNEIAQTVAANHGNTLAENARLFALVNVAMADAGIVAWDAKYVYDFWRPVTAIRSPLDDGNLATTEDPNWTPLGAPAPSPFTPPFPAYTSGHATFGAALFGVLKDFYGTDVDTLTVHSAEPLAGPDRTYHSFSEAAEENGQSRIYLGIHWSFDKVYGIQTGNQVADYIYGHEMQPVPEPSTFVLAGLGGLTLLAIAVRRRRRH